MIYIYIHIADLLPGKAELTQHSKAIILQEKKRIHSETSFTLDTLPPPPATPFFLSLRISLKKKKNLSVTILLLFYDLVFWE